MFNRLIKFFKNTSHKFHAVSCKIRFQNAKTTLFELNNVKIVILPFPLVQVVVSISS